MATDPNLSAPHAGRVTIATEHALVRGTHEVPVAVTQVGPLFIIQVGSETAQISAEDGRALGRVLLFDREQKPAGNLQAQSDYGRDQRDVPVDVHQDRS